MNNNNNDYKNINNKKNNLFVHQKDNSNIKNVSDFLNKKSFNDAMIANARAVSYLLRPNTPPCGPIHF